MSNFLVILKLIKSRSHLDPCEVELKRGTCESGSVTVEQRYYFNKESAECETFAFGGCDSNENNFLSKSECENMCIYRRGKNINAIIITTPTRNGKVPVKSPTPLLH